MDIGSEKICIPMMTCKIKYLTTSEHHCNVSDASLSAFCYNEKIFKKLDCLRRSQSPYIFAKKSFVESRGQTWMLHSRRSGHLLNCVKDLHSVLTTNAVLHVQWSKPCEVQLLLNSGLVVNILLSEKHDIERVFFDNSLMMKILIENGNISNAVVTDKCCLLCYDDQDKLAYVSFARRLQTPVKQMTSKMSSMDMKISFHSLQEKFSSKSNRKLCVNETEDAFIWWCFSSSSIPSQMTRKEEVNIILLSCSTGKLQVVHSINTHSNPVYVEFSKINQQEVHSLERTLISITEGSLQFVIYEFNDKQLQRLDCFPIPVPSGVLSCSRNCDETKLAVGCTDGTIIVCDLQTKIIQARRDPMVPSIVSWHPDGRMIMVASGNAELKCFDCSLAAVSISLLDDAYKSTTGPFKLSQFLPGDNGLVSFLCPTKVQHQSDSFKTSTTQADIALLLFDGGPFAFLQLHLCMDSYCQLGSIEVIREHISHDNLKAAVQMLYTINWTLNQEEAFLAMMTIFNYILKQPLSCQTEELLEQTLSSFYAPKHPISGSVIIEKRHALSRYARRFFHHLLEYGRLQKAFLLAKDIQDRDLFVDIYFNAKKCGEITVAKAAKQKMIELYSSSENESSSDDSFLMREGPSGAQKKRKKNQSGPMILNRRSKASVPVLQREIVPMLYPLPKIDDFMKSLMKETKKLKTGSEYTAKGDEVPPKNVVQTGSTLKILDYGYV